MKYAKNILETIGNTPLVKLNKVTAEVDASKVAGDQSDSLMNMLQEKYGNK